MSVDATASSSPVDPLKGFKQASLFKKLKDSQSSGQLMLTGSSGNSWTIYLYLGRIIYAFGGKHPVRAWIRHLSANCSHIAVPRSALQQTLTDATYEEVGACWQYQVLSLWMIHRKITREQATQVVRDIILEVLFDIDQEAELTIQVSQGKPFTQIITLIDPEQAIAQMHPLLEGWRSTTLANTSPNVVPLIPKSKQLQSGNSQNTMLSGQYTLRDISINMKRDLPKVVQMLIPYIQSGMVELTEVPDFPAPTLPLKPLPPEPAAPPPPTSPTIACIDDSPLICQEMQKILAEDGYQFVEVNDPLRAIAVLLSRKPDLIFLDLIMPNANGYEICGRLRKLTQFRNTPIIILTGQDGIVDRVRAKLVGASDFLSKPASKETVLGVIRKYLHQQA